jgi:hypothetical protein
MLVHTWLTCASALALFERSVIGSIENKIDFTIKTRQHGIVPENN